MLVGFKAMATTLVPSSFKLCMTKSSLGARRQLVWRNAAEKQGFVLSDRPSSLHLNGIRFRQRSAVGPRASISSSDAPFLRGQGCKLGVNAAFLRDRNKQRSVSVRSLAGEEDTCCSRGSLFLILQNEDLSRASLLFIDTSGAPFCVPLWTCRSFQAQCLKARTVPIVV
jgi:hypothetical protein